MELLEQVQHSKMSRISIYHLMLFPTFLLSMKNLLSNETSVVKNYQLQTKNNETLWHYVVSLSTYFHTKPPHVFVLPVQHARISLADVSTDFAASAELTCVAISVPSLVYWLMGGQR